MIVIATTNMNWTPFPIISSLIIMYLSLKDVSITCNFNKKQHAMFMLARHMLFNSYDNLKPIKPFFTSLGGDVGTCKSRVIKALLTLVSSWQQPNY